MLLLCLLVAVLACDCAFGVRVVHARACVFWRACGCGCGFECVGLSVLVRVFVCSLCACKC